MSGSLKHAIDTGGMITAPGVGDALQALLAEQAGFDAVAISGYAVAATFGYPDIGLVSMTETVQRAAQICAAVKVPVIADADNGYGNALNVTRTVRALEQAGVAAFFLEDQQFPKRCGGLPGVDLVTAEEMCAKIRAALDVRANPETMLIARTDAFNGPGGFDEAVRRARLYREAGAEVILLHGLRTVDELQALRRSVDGPLMLTVGSRTDIPVEKLRQIGIQIVMYPLTMLRSSIVAMRQSLDELRRNGVIDHGSHAMVAMSELHRLLGAERYRAMEERYAHAAGES